jgi:hypothetical protein
MKAARILWTFFCIVMAASVLVVRAAPSEQRRPTPLPAPTLVSPANGATVTGTVTLKWNAVPGAKCYHLQAHLNPYFDQQYNIIEQWCLTGTSYTFTPSPGFIVYFPHLYWRVQAKDANNTGGAWSEIRLVKLK